ncbi:MAG: HD domain-containing protein [Chloroflexota bacterium]
MPTIDDARNWYPENDPVHGFDHILRVHTMAARLALAEGADLEIVRAAALLHDVDGGQSSAVSGQRLTHQHAAATFAHQTLAAENWPEERVAAVQHCIRAHRFRGDPEQPQTIEAQVLFDADKLDAIGAIGAVRAIAYAVLAEQNLFANPSELFRQTGQKESGEPHTPYHEHLFKLSKLQDRMYTAAGRAIAEERHRFLEAFFDRLQAELKTEA